MPSKIKAKKIALRQKMKKLSKIKQYAIKHKDDYKKREGSKKKKEIKEFLGFSEIKNKIKKLRENVFFG